jgi:hypothetical protein
MKRRQVEKSTCCLNSAALFMAEHSEIQASVQQTAEREHNGRKEEQQ